MRGEYTNMPFVRILCSKIRTMPSFVNRVTNVSRIMLNYVVE